MDKAFIHIRGPLVNILVTIAPDVYGPYVMVGKKGEKQLLVQCFYCFVWNYGGVTNILQEVCQEFEVKRIQAQPL
jgi:hypothetical protein